MTKEVFLNGHTWAGEHEFTGDLNAVALDHSAELQNATTFASAGNMEREAGLKDIGINMEGFVDADEGAQDGISFGKIGVSRVPISVSPDGVAGNLAYFFRGGFGTYSLGGSIGDMLSFNFNAQSSDGDGLIRGILGHEATETATGTGTAIQLGAVTADQKLYAAIHVLEASGTTPTLDVKIESDDASGMSSPVDRITFSQFTDIGSEWGTAAGAILDDWFRVNFTIGGTTPSFKFVVVFGVK